MRECFQNRCPYCHQNLAETTPVVEHLDGMNRYRAGLHVPGNVLVACGRCNSEKRRDDARKILLSAASGWESFLSHNGTHCDPSCRTCQYWEKKWEDQAERNIRLNEALERISQFRTRFPEFQAILPDLIETLPAMLTKLYSDCQSFAEYEIRMLLERFKKTSQDRYRILCLQHIFKPYFSTTGSSLWNKGSDILELAPDAVDMESLDGIYIEYENLR